MTELMPVTVLQVSDFYKPVTQSDLSFRLRMVILLTPDLSCS